MLERFGAPRRLLALGRPQSDATLNLDNSPLVGCSLVVDTTELLCLQRLPLILGLAGLGGGLYYAKQNGMLDGMLGAPPTGSGPAKVRADSMLLSPRSTRGPPSAVQSNAAGLVQ